MSQEDKPFACSVPGCGQCFANSDHLAVHQQKHELSLKFGSRQEVVMDQTPTPTRFLKNIEESGLFDELQTNPFDQDFKQAAQSSKAKGLGLAGGISPSTPIRIQLPGSNFTLTVPGILASQLATSQALAAAAAANQQQQLSSQESSESQKGNSQEFSIDSSNQSAIPKIPVAPPPNIANPEKEVPKATPPADSNASSSVKQRLREALQKKTSAGAPYYKTPYITIPATPEILQQALSTVLPASGLTGTTYTATPPVSHTVTMETDGSETESKDEPVTRRRRKYSDTPPEEPEEKRQKFLERNRAAAMRCRQKKKVWVENLEKKSKDLEQTNNQLQNEVNYLRNEVHQLKTILLAHKDCPLIISQQQQIARVIQQLGSVVTPANTTVEAAAKLATSQSEVNFIANSLNGPQSEDNGSTQQLEKLVYAATATTDSAGNTEQ